VNAIQHYGWKVSPYSAKTRSYLQYIGIHFEDIEPSAFLLYRKVQPAVGRIVMPTVRLTNGEWLQDSSVIIDHFENISSTPSIHPSGSTQRLASYLLEVFADEWLPMAALHYRWNFPHNTAFARREFARCSFPWLPVQIGQIFTESMARKMQGYLHVLGVNDDTISGVEETVQVTLTSLENQLQISPYILGGRPCLGDFALYGPLWAHLYRDPASKKIFGPYTKVVEWMERLSKGAPKLDDFLDNDLVPEALDPLFEIILRDQWSWIQTLVRRIDDYCSSHPKASRVPRSLGEDEFSICGKAGQRKLATFVQWKAQRVTAAYIESGTGGQMWVRDMIGQNYSEFPIPTIANPFELSNNKAILQARPKSNEVSD
jgi:glutathione S-transferase